MTPLWHPVSALLLTDPVMLATRRILKMLLVAGGATEVTYAGDRMHPAVRHGDRVRVEPIGDRPPEAGEVVVAAEGSAPDLVRVTGVDSGRIVVAADADPAEPRAIGPGALLARARLPLRLVSPAGRRLRRLALDLREAVSGRVDDADAVLDKYQAQAAFYAHAEGEAIAPEVLARIAGSVARGGRILVAGSGAGKETIALAEAGYLAKGIDFAPAMVEAARSRGSRATFETGDLRTWVEPPGSLDAVHFTYDVYSFLPGRATRVAVLRKMRAWLAPGGRVLLSARIARGAWPRLLLAPRRGDSHTRWIASDGTLRRSYVHVFPERALASEIAEGGFREIAPPLPGHREIVPR